MVARRSLAGLSIALGAPQWGHGVALDAHEEAFEAPVKVRAIETVPDDVMQRLSKYSWPGNVRELENVIERAVILTQGTALQLTAALSEGGLASGQPGAVPDLSTRLEDIERVHILRVLEECDWRIKGEENAAEKLGLHPSTLVNRLKKLGIERPASAQRARSRAGTKTSHADAFTHPPLTK